MAQVFSSLTEARLDFSQGNLGILVGNLAGLLWDFF